LAACLSLFGWNLGPLGLHSSTLTAWPLSNLRAEVWWDTNLLELAIAIQHLDALCVYVSVYHTMAAAGICWFQAAYFPGEQLLWKNYMLEQYQVGSMLCSGAPPI